MFDPHFRSTGTDYTSTVCLLALAFLFTPALLIISRPLGYASVSMAILCAVTCSALAWIRWKRSSLLAIASIAGPK